MSERASALRVAVAAMFVALTLIVSMLPTIPGAALKFVGFSLLLAGLLVGPKTGFAVGCLTDVIGFALHPNGWFFPGFTLTQGLTAMIPGYLARGVDPLTWQPLRSQPSEPSLEPVAQSPWRAYSRLLGAFALTQTVTSVLLVSVFTSKVMLGTPLAYELSKSALIQMVHVPIYSFLALAVLRALSQTDLYGRILKARR